MKLVQTTIIAGLSFFLSTGISFAADMDDIELTIRVVETDDVEEMHNVLSLPDAASDTAREHAENEDGRGLTQANAAHEEHKKDDAHDEEREEHDEDREDHEDEVEDHGDTDEEHDEAHEEEDHEEEHENERDDTTDPAGTNL